MKSLKKVISLVLACALALSMLTACGSSSGSSSDAIEKAVNQSLSNSSAGLSLNHDTKLDEKAKAFFNSRLNSNFEKTLEESYADADIDTSVEYVDDIDEFVSSDLIAMSISQLTLEAYINGCTFNDFGYYSSYYTDPYTSEQLYVTIVVFTYTTGGGTISQPDHSAISKEIGLPYNSTLINKAKLLCEAVLSGKYYENENALFAAAGIDTTCEYPEELDELVSADFISLGLKEMIAEASNEGYNFTAFGLYTSTYTDSDGSKYPYTVVVFSYE